MNAWLNKFHVQVVRVLAHQYFFIGVLVFFALNALWLALSATYPMIFDEDYHVGIIDIYSQQLSPFISLQPAEASFYGDITRLTSYFYHYLMSFPYRFTGLFTDDLTTKIIILRLLNVVFVVCGLVLWRKVLDRLKLARAASHAVLFSFVLIPLSPFVAAQVNYDNLIFLLLPLLILATLRFMNTKAHHLVWALLVIGLSGFMIIIKFTMLPVVAVVAVMILLHVLVTHKSRIFSLLVRQFKQTKKLLLILTALFALIGVGLFIERYAGNLIRFGDFRPSCPEVQPVEVCRNYSVWVRNENAREQAQFLDRATLWGPWQYSVDHWVPHIFTDLFVTASFIEPEPKLHQFTPEGMQSIKGSGIFTAIGWTIFWVGIFLTIVYWRYLPSRRVRYFLLAIFLVYVTALWVTNYMGYRSIGMPYATQGRYVLPFVIPMLGLAVLAYGQFFRKVPYLKSIFFMLAFIIALQGAGALSFIIYSNVGWQWDYGRFEEWNTALRHLLQPILRW